MYCLEVNNEVEKEFKDVSKFLSFFFLEVLIEFYWNWFFGLMFIYGV